MSDEEFDDNFHEDDLNAPDEHGGGELHDEHHDEHGEEFHDEDWESLDEDGVAHENAPVKNKKKIDKIIIGVAIIAAVGFMLIQMGHKKNPGAARNNTAVAVPVNTPAAQTAATPVPTPQDVVYGGAATANGHAAASQPVKPLQSGFLNDPNALKNIEQIQASHTAPTPVAPEQPSTPPSSLTPQEMTQSPPMPAPITAAATPAITMPTQKMPLATVKPVAQQPLTPLPDMTAAPAIKAGSATADAAISGQLDSIAGKLGNIETQIKALQDTAARKDELQDLKSQVSALQTRVGTLASAPAPHQAVVNDVGGPVAERNPASAKPARHATYHKHAVKPKKMEMATSANDAETAPYHLTPMAKASPAPAHVNNNGGWTLKSAQPGVAMVAKNDGQLLIVKPGDSLPGIGRVKDIFVSNGQWVVSAAGGRITE